MKYLASVFALSLLFLASCTSSNEPPTSPSDRLNKTTHVEDVFTWGMVIDCCGGDFVKFEVKFTSVENENGIHYNWKANDVVTGASGATYHVFYTDNGIFEYDEYGGRVGTLHFRVVRDDGCTYTMTVKLRWRYDANGNLVKDVYEFTYDCDE